MKYSGAKYLPVYIAQITDAGRTQPHNAVV
jgi:hypothetical protein